MSTDLALNHPIGGGYDTGVATWNYWDGANAYPPVYPAYPWYPTPVYPLTIHTLTYGSATTKEHRICTCPNCNGSCCDCADCKVKRLEARVAELEQK